MVNYATANLFATLPKLTWSEERVLLCAVGLYCSNCWQHFNVATVVFQSRGKSFKQS